MAMMLFTADAALDEISAKLSRSVPADGPRLRIDVGEDLQILLSRAEWNALVRQGNAAFDDIPPTRNSLAVPVRDIHTQLPKGLL